MAEKALKKALQGFEEPRLKEIIGRIMGDKTPCQFDRDLENIKCGSSLIILRTKPQLHFENIPWYGEGFAGYQGTFRISSAWSYAGALERLKATTKFSKFAEEVSNYAEELESRGDSVDAVLLRKKAWEVAKSGKQVASPSLLLGGAPSMNIAMLVITQ